MIIMRKDRSKKGGCFMKWNIITDSSCDLTCLEYENENIVFSDVPFVIRVDDKDFIDDKSLNVDEMMNVMKESLEASTTACPSPYAWFEKFESEGYVIAITISKELSGSYNSALTAKNMILEENPNRKIAILNSYSTGPASVLAVKKICELIEKGFTFEKIVEKTEEYIKNMHTAFALCNFDNLIKSGRINKMAGRLASVLDFWGIGNATDAGTIKLKQKVRGKKKSITAIIDEMKEKRLADNKIIISHCYNSEFAKKLKEEIEKIWQSAEITIMKARGLNSYYAEMGGIIISY